MAPTITSIAPSTARSTTFRRRTAGRAGRLRAHPEDDTRYFEACLPIEELARRGRDTLRFGPMKPMGLTDPRTGRRPWAVVQLRQENLRAQSFNLVGFQNHMKFGDQARVLRLIPGLERPNSCASARSIAIPTSTRRRCSLPRCSCARGREILSSPARFPAWKATWKPSPPD
jgi:hypothetical protein